MDLEGVLEVLGVDLATPPSNENGEIKLYTQFGKHPVANLIVSNNRFILRFGEAVEATSVCEITPTGGVRAEPVKLKINKE